MIRTLAIATVLAASLSTSAHAAPNVRDAIHAATSQAIASQGNRALRMIKAEAFRVLRPALPAPTQSPTHQEQAVAQRSN